jgi:hypothetical protein
MLQHFVRGMEICIYFAHQLLEFSIPAKLTSEMLVVVVPDVDTDN